MDQSLENTISDKDIANMECTCQPGPRTLMGEYSREEKDVANFLLEMASGTRLTESKAVQVTSGSFPQKFVDTINNSNVNTFTGLPSIDVLNALVTCYKKIHPLSGRHQLCAKERIALTLVKLKHNISTAFLSHLFNCSLTTCSNIIAETVQLLSEILKVTVAVPPKEDVVEHLPICFKHFSNVHVIVACTEIPIGQPNCLRCALQTYSFYKKGFTVKYMVTVTPSGLIAHISQGYGGRTSGKAVFEQSGLIKQLDPISDAIMADRGFLIDDICADHLIELIRPPFRKQKQMSKGDALRTQKIASARVHVERAIQRMKIFKVLSTRIPWSMVGLLDDIVIIAAGITNLSSPILATHRFL
ncbi:uncharacterized protein LOC142567831 [Dermacentor variabilis]|uniref:uncharacterized protein LOC142567831 n=1 Tax=Dermacentor variabilis TaxID=34621 RepID=UPI003F5C9218